MNTRHPKNKAQVHTESYVQGSALCLGRLSDLSLSPELMGLEKEAQEFQLVSNELIIFFLQVL